MKERINVTLSSMPSLEEYVEEIRDLWDSRWLSNRGAKSIEFERLLLERLDAPNVYLFANGHVALEVAIQALGLKGEVITTPYTHCSTTHSIMRNGLTPVFCDVEDEHYTLNPELIEAQITERTSAIVATHVYGFLCDVDAIQKIADRHNLRVIYDAAHAFGVKKGGVSAANFGDAAMFSCHATKVFHTIEGGIVAYQDAELFAKMPPLVNFGFTSHEDVDYVGTNARMNEFEAAMGICNLRHFDDDVTNRRTAAERYYERLSGQPGIRLLSIPDDLEWNYSYFPVLFEGKKNRNQVKADLESQNIYARKYFYPSIDKAACYAGMFDETHLPIAHYAADHVLTLPMSSELTIADVDRICDAIVD